MVKKLENELRESIDLLAKTNREKSNEKEADLRLYLTASAFGTPYFKSVRSLLATAYSSNFDKEIIDMMIKRIFLIMGGRKVDAACLLDEVVDRLRRLKGK